MYIPINIICVSSVKSMAVIVLAVIGASKLSY